MSNIPMDSDPNDPGHLLLREADRNELLKPLILQLNKDFELSGLDCSISEKALPGQIAKELHRILEKLIRDDFQGFLNLLYRIDVPESGIHRTDNQDMEEFIATASYQLLKREWQKVWFRNKIQ